MRPFAKRICLFACLKIVHGIIQNLGRFPRANFLFQCINWWNRWPFFRVKMWHWHRPTQLWSENTSNAIPRFSMVADENSFVFRVKINKCCRRHQEATNLDNLFSKFFSDRATTKRNSVIFINPPKVFKNIYKIPIKLFHWFDFEYYIREPKLVNAECLCSSQ